MTPAPACGPADAAAPTQRTPAADALLSRNHDAWPLKAIPHTLTHTSPRLTSSMSLKRASTHRQTRAKPRRGTPKLSPLPHATRLRISHPRAQPALAHARRIGSSHTKGGPSPGTLGGCAGLAALCFRRTARIGVNGCRGWGPSRVQTVNDTCFHFFFPLVTMLYHLACTLNMLYGL